MNKSEIAERAAREVSPSPSPDAFQEAWAKYNKAGLSTGWERVGFVGGFKYGFDAGRKSAEGDTRELKAALRKALLIHWLSQIECNHEEKNDSAICACGWKSERAFNVGKAVELWIDHVFAELG